MILLTLNLISEAIETLLLHSNSVHSILNRKPVTKELLFKYLHHNKVPVRNDFTKQLLIDNVIKFWKEKYSKEEWTQSEQQTDSTRQNEIEMTEAEPSSTTFINVTINKSITFNPNNHKEEEDFPIHQMSRKFAIWFFTNLNEESLQASDFWRESEYVVQFFEQNVCMLEQSDQGAENLLAFCRGLHTKYLLYFNLNESHSGTQGRIDPHGLVLVLSCGSLHKIDELVGTFECVFALSRDPFTDNNWKINRIDMRLRNIGSGNFTRPALDQCESIQALYALDAPSGEVS